MNFKIKIKNPKGWNTINRRNAELILNNCVVSCNGEYSDDYYHDTQENYKRDLTSEECIKGIRESPIDYKIYWDARKKEFLFFYGQWLSYSAKPKEHFNITEEIENKPLNIPQEVKQLKDLMQERENKYIRYNFKNLTPSIVTIRERNKYYALDVGTSGKFLIDKITLSVYTIKGYGVKGYSQGTISDVKERIQQDINTFNGLINGSIIGIYALNY